MSFVIVDDRDPLIQYSPSTGWKQGNHFEQYLTTTTVAATGTGTGQTATFDFQGTSVAVYGTVDHGSSTMSFSLDRGLPSVFDAESISSKTVHHELLFASGTLTDGQHTFVMTQTGAPNFIFLDYLLYNTTSSAGNTLFFDDNDVRLEYSDGWNLQPGSEQYFQNTAHGCDVDECTVTLDFEGNSLSMYGDFNNFNAASPLDFNASIALDDGPPTPIQFAAPVLQVQPTSNFQIYSTKLTPGKHRAVLTAHSDQFLLDYFVAQNPAAPPEPAATPIPSGALQPTSPGSAPDHDSPLASGAAALQASKVPVGAIVGIAFGGLVFLLLLLVALLLWRRRARRTDEDAMRRENSTSVGQESFSALTPPAPSWYHQSQQSRPLSSFSVATYVEPSEPESNGQLISEKDVEARKGRPASRYLYYE